MHLFLPKAEPIQIGVMCRKAQDFMNVVEKKRQAAAAALSHVDDGMRLGIGTGSTAEEFIDLLAEQVAAGLSLRCVPTSQRTARLCAERNIEVCSLEEMPQLDLTIDGADEIDARLRVIKGGGGALLREKIVAAASSRMIIIADNSKCVDHLGAFGLPIEINPFGMAATRMAIERVASTQGLVGDLILRMDDDQPFRTDGGHFIMDASFGLIADPEAVSCALLEIPGVVEHGLFLGMVSSAIIAGEDGISTLSI